MKRSALAFALLTSGCVTTLDPNYAMQIQAYSDTVRSQQAVEVAKAQAEEARYNAMSAIAQNSDAGTRTMALMALALARGGASGGTVNVVLPQAPENQQDRAYKWAALFAAPTATLIQGYFGYRVASQQSNNQRDASIASYNALGSLGVAGFGANASIANSGFDTASRLGMGGITALGNRPPLTIPTITLNGTGVINTGAGDGSYVGPNSGSNSGNTGRIGSSDDNHQTCIPNVTVPC